MPAQSLYVYRQNSSVFAFVNCLVSLVLTVSTAFFLKFVSWLIGTGIHVNYMYTSQGNFMGPRKEYLPLILEVLVVDYF